MRLSSSDYREWSIDDWCEHVRSLCVNSLTAWARASRASYSRAVTLGYQRDVARKLGWLPKLEKGEMERMTDEEFSERFRAKGVKNLTEMWKSAQHWCEYLRREGRLEGIAERLGFGYLVEWHPADDISYYLERCRRVGDFKAWCQVDKNAAEAARKHGLLEAVKKNSPKRSSRSYPTAGGGAHSLSELAVARLLEANNEPFTTQLEYPFTFPRGKRHRSKADFYLCNVGAYLEVWGALPDDESPYWQDYQVRRKFKTDMCRALNLRLLHVEGQVLFRQGPEVYIAHVGAVLKEAGLHLSISLDRWSALAAIRRSK